MSKRDELTDTRADVADDAPKSGIGVFRNPDGSRMRSPESVNTTKDSEKLESEKKRRAGQLALIKNPPKACPERSRVGEAWTGHHLEF